MDLTYRRKWMLAGFAAALAGDWMLAVRGAPPRSPEFLVGVACFAAAHLFWMTGQLREARPQWRAFVAAALPLLLFTGVRVAPALPLRTGAFVVMYAAVSAFSLAVALATHRRLYLAGIALLVLSDVMIGGRILHAPGYGRLVGPTYVAAELCLMASFFRRREKAASLPSDPLRATVALGVVAAASFLAAMATVPGGGYNPCMRMLSALGRTVVREIEWPWCHYLFTVGMTAAAAAATVTLRAQRPRVSGGRRVALDWGAALNAAGLLAIAAIPENVNPFSHNVGCNLAAIGGGVALLALDRRATGRAWTVALVSATALFCAALVLHAAKVTPYAPAVPTMQKALILSFAAWLLRLAWGSRPRRRRAVFLAALALLAFPAALAGRLLTANAICPVLPAPSGSAHPAERPAPLADDELAALRWLDHVTGPLSPEEERDWWEIGGSQHGLYAKRYHIAFCGYAAAALGWRGGNAERMAAARILDRCIARYIRHDVWGYALSKSYWGRKPWAPDPCFRENVMFTGHLLQLLALYETFSGDTRFWNEGWDFVWKEDRRVHYDVPKLIDVTLHQMRHGPNGGVCCEPGLMFFPCNNHPHVALALFARLGHGDWSADARRWERWALAHYRRPLLGGGALSLVWHARSNLMLPRGHNGLDGWSLLWYEPWAADRGTALTLWREAAVRIDWAALSAAPPAADGEFDPCDPAAGVHPVASAAFLAAAARACEDPATAARLEEIADRHLVRGDGMLWLDIARDWRVGATAIRAIALAEANGFRLRDALEPRLSANSGRR